MNTLALCILGVVLGHPAMSELLSEPCPEDEAYADLTYWWPSWEHGDLAIGNSCWDEELD